METLLPSILASVFFLGLSFPGVSLAEPQPGDVFREYAWTTEELHVLGLNQKPFELPVDLDLVDAMRAEVVIEIANQHMGFEGMAKGDLFKILDARYAIASWGGLKLCHGYQINGVLLEDKPAGADWLYNLSTPPVRPLAALKSGENIFSTVVGPGRVPDIYLPGVQVLIRYRTGEAATAPVTPTSTSTASSQAQEMQKPKHSPQLRVSDNHRFLVTTNGQPFFWLGDTAWELFHRLNREETARYLEDRASKGFTVIQAVALAELDGLTVPNPQGHLPLVEGQFLRPAVVEGLDNDYWDDIEWVLRLAQRKGLYVGLLPMWGKYCPADTGNCERYGRFIGERFKDHTNIIWILGGDRPAPSKPEQDAWRAMARGIAIGVCGRDDYDAVMMTYHTSGPGHASDFFHEDRWLDFTGIQSSHGDQILNWKMIERDCNRRPTKPVIDLETTYPGISIMKGMKAGNDDHARRSAYWAVFAGAFGHTYGHNSIWQMAAPGRTSPYPTSLPWHEAIQAPSATQMGYLRGLMESRPFLTQVPDQSLLASGPAEDLDHVAALRGDGYAMVYTPSGKPFTVRLGTLEGKQVKACWYDPRTGKATVIGQFDRQGDREFVPPGTPGVGNDWVLVLDDPGRGLGPPRVALEPSDWRGFGGFDTHAWRGFLLANNRWGGGNGRIWFEDHDERWSFWTEHSDDLNGGHVKSFPHAGIGWMWGNWAPNQALPIRLGELAVAKSDWTVTLPETEPNQSYVAYYQLYTSPVPDPKSDGAKINGDLAIIIHRQDFPFEAWGKNLGEFDVDGRKWLVVQKAPAIGKSTYIIMVPVAPVAIREANRLTVEDFDLKPCIDFCVARRFYQPADFLLTIQVGWESRVLHGVLRSDDLRLTVGKKGAKPVRLPLPLPAVQRP